MMKSKGAGGHGGKRAGAGRKPRPKPTRPPLVVPPSATGDDKHLPRSAHLLSFDDAEDVRKLAREHTALAIAALAQIAEKGISEAAAVSAAKALIGIGHGGVSGDALAPVGKKVAASAKAKHIGVGKFATPPTPPRLVIDND